MKPMMNNYISKIPNLKDTSWKAWLFFVVIFLAVFLRVYNFSDWLFLKGDQVRDAIMIERSFSGGSGELPLLGPKAGGTKLHLGPIFYYFQYVSATIFRSIAPPVLAFPNLLFSILTIPLFYFFSRKFFSRDDSMLICGLFSLCYLAIEYSRFAWNPNSIPFFNLLFIYSLFNIFSKKEKGKYRWFISAAVSYSVSSQLHFSSFLALPIITLIFSIINRKKIKEYITWNNLLVFITIIVIFYIPVIISDIVTGGYNGHQFLSSIGNKSSGHSILKNIQKDFYYFGRNFFRILTGYFGSDRLYYYIGEIFMLASLAVSAVLFRKEKDNSKKQFIIIILSTLTAYFILYIPLATSIDKPRFFLPIIIIPFIFMGFIKQYLFSKNFIIFKIIFFGIVAMVFFGNAFGTLAWLSELKKSEIQAVNPKDTVILKTKKDPVWWTWSHFQKSADFIQADCKGNEIIYAMAKNVRDLSKPVQLALAERGERRPISSLKIKNITSTQNCYYYFLRTGDKPNSTVLEYFNDANKKEIGSMTILKLTTKENYTDVDQTEEIIEQDLEERSNEEKLDDISSEDMKIPRVYWNDIFKTNN